jgi:hypothetical protein
MGPMAALGRDRPLARGRAARRGNCALSQEQGGIISEGERRRVDIMSKDTAHNPQTGGWRFSRFMGSDESNELVKDAGGNCFACHSRAAAHADVFSQIR